MHELILVNTLFIVAADRTHLLIYFPYPCSPTIFVRPYNINSHVSGLIQTEKLRIEYNRTYRYTALQCRVMRLRLKIGQTLIDKQSNLSFRVIWLASSRKARIKTARSNPISQIERLLQTPIDEYRKFAVWRILTPYLINSRKYSPEETFDAIKNWLDRCDCLRRLAFNPHYMIKYNVSAAKRNGYLPISLGKLRQKTHTYTICWLRLRQITDSHISNPNDSIGRYIRSCMLYQKNLF